jgi:hypothetical protein
MRARTEVWLAIGGLVVLQLATTFGAIGLFERMDPSIAQVLTEESDVPVVDGEEDGASDSSVIERRRELHRLLVEAEAGAWAMALLGGLSLLLALFVSRRIDRRLIAPLSELDRSTRAAVRGERFRRCYVEDAPLEVRRVADSINQLMDHAERDEGRAEAAELARIDRAALLALLDDEGEAALVVDHEGKVVAMSRRAMTRWDADAEEVAADLLRAARGEDAIRVARRLSLADGKGCLIWLKPDASEDALEHEAGHGEVDGEAEHVAERSDQGVAGDGGVEPDAAGEQGQDGADGRSEGHDA